MRAWLRLALMAVVALQASAAAAQPLDFALEDVDGVERRLSEFRGRWVVVNFWATWCPPCLAEIPDLVAFHERHREGRAVVLGVNFEQIGVDELRAFVAQYRMTYPVVRAGGPPVVPFEPLLGLPSSFFVSPTGELVKRHVGPISGAQLERFLADHQVPLRASAP